MKRIFLCVIACVTLSASGALADELSTPPSLYIASPSTSRFWNGFYFGANGGYGWADSSASYTPNDAAALAGTCGGSGRPSGQCIPFPDFRMDGGLAGGQVGYNWQINAMWLVGVETDYQWSDIKGAAGTTFRLGGVGSTNTAVNETLNSFGTARIRLGAMPVNSLLLYGTAGFAYGRSSENFAVANPITAGTGSLSSGGFSYSCTAGGPSCFAGSASNTVWGWTAGAGAELALTAHLTLRTEFLYVDLGAPSGTALAQGNVAGTTPSSFAVGFAPVRFGLVRGGVNFKF